MKGREGKPCLRADLRLSSTVPPIYGHSSHGSQSHSQIKKWIPLLNAGQPRQHFKCPLCVKISLTGIYHISHVIWFWFWFYLTYYIRVLSVFHSDFQHRFIRTSSKLVTNASQLSKTWPLILNISSGQMGRKLLDWWKLCEIRKSPGRKPCYPLLV